MKKIKEPCGCTHDGVRWLELCGPKSDKWPKGQDHKGESDEVHARAQRDHETGTDSYTGKVFEQDYGEVKFDANATS